MNPLEIVVLIFAILTILKAISFLFIKQKPIVKIIGWLSKKTWFFSIVLAFGILVYGYFLSAYLSLVQLMAGVILGVGMMGLFFIQYPKPMMAMYKEMMRSKRKVFIGFFFFVILSIMVIWFLLIKYA